MSETEANPPSPKLTDAMRAAQARTSDDVAPADDGDDAPLTAADLAASGGNTEPAGDTPAGDSPAGHDDPAAAGSASMSDEAIVALIAERDEYVDALQRLKAEFANARRRSEEQATAQRSQAASDLVNRLLPVLDSAQAALDQGVEEVRPITDALLEVLTGQGLSLLDPVGEPFDPQMHEAVLFESGEGDQVVVETMRLGYAWNERVLRAAMVKVRG